MNGTDRPGAHIGAMVFAGITGVVLIAMLSLLGSSDSPASRTPAPTARGSVAPTTPVVARPRPEDLDSAWVSQSPPATVAIGQEASLTFKFKNTGRAAWVRGAISEASLAFTGDSARFDPRMAVDWPTPQRAAVQMEPTVAPGEVATFTFKVRGVVAGAFRIDLRPALESVAWLRDEGVYAEVTVR